MNLSTLASGTRNSRTMDLDALSTLESAHCSNQQDMLVVEAVEATLPEVTRAVDVVADVLKVGGRIIYIGTGTGGRLGVLDASEYPPTFGIPHDLMVGLIAGGPGAPLKAVRGAEDNPQPGEDDLRMFNLTTQDLMVGLVVPSRTPYVIGELKYMRSVGCTTTVISCNLDSPVVYEADTAISPVMGSETLAGPIRLKSNTVQKLVLNIISTSMVVKFGRVYQNLMVGMQVINVELIDRACRMVVEATGIARAQTETLLRQTSHGVKPAILMVFTGLDAAAAREELAAHQGFLRTAPEH